MKLEIHSGRLGQGGQAMVEFSVMMIVFIPLLVWSWYFMDIGHHMLDLQETVISTTWDYTGRTNQHGDKDTETLQSVYHANRFEYIDHTSAFDHYDDLGSASDEKKYHYEIGARAAWVTKDGSGKGDPTDFATDYNSDGARQVVCLNDHEEDTKWLSAGISGLSGANPVQSFGKSDLNKSGLMTCWAKLSVYNYVIPEKFMQEHAHVDLTDRQHNDYDSDVEQLAAAAKPLVLKDHAAISFGTWAINNGDSGELPSQSGDTDGDIDYCPKATNPFYQRVSWVTTGGGFTGYDPIADMYHLVELAGTAFMAKGLSSDLAIITSIPAMPGSTDGSPEGFSCPDASVEALLGRPANVIGVNLIARHHRDTGDRTEQSPISEDTAAAAGPKYESTPFEQGGGDFQTAWNNRGQFYMGNTSEQN